ncbi:MAG: glutaredoxin family protein [Acidobacteria bacterium]|nr:glutaredoxin family protein [Acidobacteriota bacterium]
MKAWLSRAGVPHVVRDIGEDPSAYDELAALQILSIPVTLVGDTPIVGFNPRALEEALGRRQ